MTTYLLAIHVVARCVVIWSDESLFEFVLIFLAPLFVAIHAVARLCTFSHRCRVRETALMHATLKNEPTSALTSWVISFDRAGCRDVSTTTAPPPPPPPPPEPHQMCDLRKWRSKVRTNPPNLRKWCGRLR